MNLFDLVKSQLGDEVIAKVAGTVGETPAATAKALTGGAVPALLAGIVSNFGSSENGAARLLDLVSAGKHDGSLLNNLAGALGGGAQSREALAEVLVHHAPPNITPAMMSRPIAAPCETRHIPSRVFARSFSRLTACSPNNAAQRSA